MDIAGGDREQQRRHATVIFADISGFTAMSEKLDPEEVTDVMNACFRMIEGIILEHGGTVDKFIGDCVMALFGASHAIENAARHAVEASLEIRSQLESFNHERQLPVPLAIHIGVNSGVVIAGDVGGEKKRDFTVMGDTVNLAARLEDASEKGQVFVGPTTYADTRSDFEYRAVGPLRLKGKAEPIRAYEAIGPRRDEPRARLGRSSREISGALVGRAAEVRTLREHVQRFCRGSGGVISIIGEAGIGKSRLLEEMVAFSELEQACVLIGRCDSIGSRQAFHPFVDLLQGWAEIRSEDGDKVSLEKLETAVARVLPQSEDVLPLVATLMGLRPTGAGAERLRGIAEDGLENLIFKAIADLFEAIAAERPLVLVFEDLHWADLSSVKLLEALQRIAARSRVLFVHAFRPAFGETSDRVLAALRNRSFDVDLVLALAPLSESQSLALVRSLIGIERLPSAVRELLVGKAEGNPLFIEEVIRSLIDQGAIASRPEGLEVTDRIGSVTIPGTLQEVIAVRFEQLDPESRRVLQLAAVIGRSFPRAILEQLVDAGIDLEEALGVLVERQVLEERRSHASSSTRRRLHRAERELRFRHALIQEAVYESLLLRRRREIHLRVAEAVERVFANRLEDFHGFLALHYTRAEKLDLAEDHLVRAGEEAVRSAASSEALRYFREASRIFDLLHGDRGDPQKRFEIEKHLASALLLTGNLAEARPHFDRALEHLGEKVARGRFEANRQMVSDLLRILFRVYVLRGRMPTTPSTPEAREALTLLYNRARAESVAGYAEWFLHDSLYMTGKLTKIDPRTVEQSFAQWAGVALLFSYSGLSFDLSRRVSRIAKSLLRPERRGDLLTYHLMNFMRDYFEGRWQEPSGVDAKLLSEVLRQGLFWDADTFLGMDCEKLIDQGRFAAARERIREIASLSTEYGYRFAESTRVSQSAFLALEERRLEEAVEALQLYEQRPEETLNLLALGAKAEALVLKGDLDAARAAIARAEALLGGMGRAAPYHRGRFETSRLLVGVAALERSRAAGDAREVRRLRRQVARAARAALATAAVLARIRTQTYALLGTFHWLANRQRRALRWFERSICEGRRLGARPALAWAYVEAARRLSSPEARVASMMDLTPDGLLDEAARLFEEMGLGPEQARCAQMRSDSTDAAPASRANRQSKGAFAS